MTKLMQDNSAMRALAGDDFRVHVNKSDFLVNGFERVTEPLNLFEAGRAWFRKVYLAHRNHNAMQALVLGATPWLGRLAAEYCEQVLLADHSPAMIEWAKQRLQPIPKNCTLVQSEWLRLEFPSIDLVLGDNSFSFATFPEGWIALRDHLLQACRDSAQLFLRFFSAPPEFIPLSTEALVHEALCHNEINYTAFRTAYMLSSCSRDTHCIDMDALVGRFERERETLVPLIEKFGLPEANDLVTIRKYAGTGVKLYVPPIQDIIGLFAPYFQVRDVSYGPILLARHFPLVVFEKINRRAPERTDRENT